NVQYIFLLMKDYFARSSARSRIVLSNSSSISGFSLYVKLLTMIVTIKFNKNPGTISYKLLDNTSTLPQIKTVIAPTTIPDKAPMFVIRFQYNVSKIIGPKEAPNPAHAKDTSFKIVSVFAQAKPRATTETINTDILPKKT